MTEFFAFRKTPERVMLGLMQLADTLGTPNNGNVRLAPLTHQAIAEYLSRGNYVNIVAALRAGVGLSGGNLADEIGLYSGGNYTTIPYSYGASQGTPEG